MATAIDENDADGQLGKSIWRLLNFCCTSIHGKSEKGQVFKKISTEKEVKSRENIICLLYCIL